MKSFFNIHIKGSHIWKLCALVGLGIFLSCCVLKIYNIQQPATANAGDIVPITTRDSTQTNIVATPLIANYIAAILLPKGWDAGNHTTVTYTSTLGDGDMQIMPADILEPQSIGQGTNLNYAAAMKKKFGIGQNLVDDLEWIVFRSVQPVSIPNGAHDVGNINFKITVGLDGKTTIFKTAFVICESAEGLNNWDAADPDWNFVSGPRMTVNGPGDVNDLCDPQLTSIDPPKSLDNDFITLSYNEKLDTLNTLKGTALYMCVDTAYTSDGQVLTGFCEKSAKTLLTQTTSNSGLYKITFWPHAFFGVSASQSVTKVVYHIIDAAGNSVGFADTSAPFTFKFGCN